MERTRPKETTTLDRDEGVYISVFIVCGHKANNVESSESIFTNKSLLDKQ